jgi:ADP-heptose:LPS heptosyltransferase
MRLLLAREAFGFGDWVMTMSLVRMINRQHPEVAIDFEIAGVPRTCLEILLYSEGRAAPVHGARREEYDRVVEHVGYPFRPVPKGRHILESMVERFVEQTGLPLRYEPDALARYRGPAPDVATPRPPFVLMPSLGKQRPFDARKEWTPGSFAELARRLARSGVAVVQVGCRGDPPLRAARQRHFDVPLPVLHALMRRASLLVALENGLSHFAGHNALPTCTLYCAAGTDLPGPAETGYPGQTPLCGALGVERVLETVLDVIGGPPRARPRPALGRALRSLAGRPERGGAPSR